MIIICAVIVVILLSYFMLGPLVYETKWGEAYYRFVMEKILRRVIGCDLNGIYSEITEEMQNSVLENGLVNTPIKENIPNKEPGDAIDSRMIDPAVPAIKDDNPFPPNQEMKEGEFLSEEDKKVDLAKVDLAKVNFDGFKEKS